MAIRKYDERFPRETRLSLLAIKVEAESKAKLWLIMGIGALASSLGWPTALVLIGEVLGGMSSGGVHACLLLFTFFGSLGIFMLTRWASLVRTAKRAEDRLRTIDVGRVPTNS